MQTAVGGLLQANEDAVLLSTAEPASWKGVCAMLRRTQSGIYPACSFNKEGEAATPSAFLALPSPPQKTSATAYHE